MAAAGGDKVPLEWNALTRRIIGAAIEVHRHLGPGLREKFYEQAMVHELESIGLRVARQVPFRVEYKGKDLGVQVIDTVAESLVVLEFKSVERLSEIDHAQIIGYLRFSGLPLGLLFNFNVAQLKEAGVHRKINYPPAFRSRDLFVQSGSFSVPSVQPL
jgi:GxxExxY protein